MDGKETCDKQAITNAFNKYFVQVGLRLANKIHNTTDPLTYVTFSVNIIFISYVMKLRYLKFCNPLKIVVPVRKLFWPVLANH